MCHVCLSYVWLSLPKFILRCMNCLEFASPYCSLRGCLLHCDVGPVVITMLASLLLLSFVCFGVGILSCVDGLLCCLNLL